jgi:hypothetical protein
MMSVQQSLTVNHSDLIGPVRRLLHSEAVTVDEWSCRRVHGGASIDGSGVYRVAGRGSDGGAPVSWSLILKVMGTAGDGLVDLPQREKLIYQDGLLEELPGGVRTPRCLGISERPDGGDWIWLEELVDAIGPRWPLEHYGLVARQLGRFNGAYLAGRARPAMPWLSSGWLRGWTERAAPGIDALPGALEDPLVRRVYPAALAEGFLRLWAERERLFAVLDRLPQTFCHNDAFRRNLFAQRDADGQYTTALIDWSYAGTGALGTDLAPLVAANLAFFEVAPEDAAELDRIAFAGYLDGLRDAGWDGDPRLVRFGYVAASSMRYGVGVVGLMLTVLLDERTASWVEQAFGRPLPECVAGWSAAVAFRQAQVEEVWALLDAVIPAAREHSL